MQGASSFLCEENRCNSNCHQSRFSITSVMKSSWALSHDTVVQVYYPAVLLKLFILLILFHNLNYITHNNNVIGENIDVSTFDILSVKKPIEKQCPVHCGCCVY